MQTENNSINSPNALDSKLKDIGFEKTDFEPVVLNRFIAKIDGIPSYVIHSVHLPNCTFYRNKERKTVEPRWDSLLFFLYNPVNIELEKLVLEIGKKDDVEIEVRYLDPIGNTVTYWKIKGELTAVDYGQFDWKNTGDPNDIKLTFKVKEANIE